MAMAARTLSGRGTAGGIHPFLIQHTIGGENATDTSGATLTIFEQARIRSFWL